MRPYLSLLVLYLALNCRASVAEPPPTRPAPDVRAPSVDRLLGRAGRQQHAARLAALAIDGKVHPWESFARWGRELFHLGQVAEPPTGPAPSTRLSNFYRCVDCHNDRREDPNLTDQDPEARALLVESDAPSDPKTRLRLTPGTTLWGAVNRESFYNDSYEIYHSLVVPPLRAMNPERLEDATQVCCKFCGVGRYANKWEIAALLTYFWELELTLADLDLPPAVRAAVLSVLTEPDQGDPERVQEMRAFLQRQYLTRAGDDAVAGPEIDNDGTVGTYPDQLRYRGDPELGQKLYAAACDRCHGAGKVNESQGADLIADPARFHEILRQGTHRNREAYMPMFTAQRLSRQQVADIQSYLESR